MLNSAPHPPTMQHQTPQNFAEAWTFGICGITVQMYDNELFFFFEPHKQCLCQDVSHNFHNFLTEPVCTEWSRTQPANKFFGIF